MSQVVMKPEKLTPDQIALIVAFIDALTPLVAGRPILTLALAALKAFLATQG